MPVGHSGCDQKHLLGGRHIEGEKQGADGHEKEDAAEAHVPLVSALCGALGSELRAGQHRPEARRDCL
jgi:hypothetical protein